MTEIVIDKKKYILIADKDYQALQKQAALKTKPEKLLSAADARAYSKKLIQKWQQKSNRKAKCRGKYRCYILVH